MTVVTRELTHQPNFTEQSDFKGTNKGRDVCFFVCVNEMCVCLSGACPGQCVRGSEKWKLLSVALKRFLSKGQPSLIRHTQKMQQVGEDLWMCTSKVGVRTRVYVSFFLHLLIGCSLSP